MLTDEVGIKLDKRRFVSRLIAAAVIDNRWTFAGLFDKRTTGVKDVIGSGPEHIELCVVKSV